jgi:hypothetical protein
LTSLLSGDGGHLYALDTFQSWLCLGQCDSHQVDGIEKCLGG